MANKKAPVDTHRKVKEFGRKIGHTNKKIRDIVSKDTSKKRRGPKGK